MPASFAVFRYRTRNQQQPASVSNFNNFVSADDAYSLPLEPHEYASELIRRDEDGSLHIIARRYRKTVTPDTSRVSVTHVALVDNPPDPNCVTHVTDGTVKGVDTTPTD